MDKRKVYYKRIQEIIKSEKALSILLIGEGAKVEEKDFNTLKDIDLFVITDENHGFQREITEIEGVLFDISYMPVNLLRRSLNDALGFIINSLQRYRVVYNKLEDLEELLYRIKSIYVKGPKNLKASEVEYIRFKLYQDYEDILHRKEDTQNSLFLINNLFHGILISYFKLKHVWVPKDKKIINNIQNIDKILYNLCMDFSDENNFNQKLIKLYEILDYVLRPYGGVLKFWKRGRFPLV